MKMKEQVGHLSATMTKAVVAIAAAWSLPELIEVVDLMTAIAKGAMSIAVLGATFAYWRVKTRRIEKGGDE